MAPKLTIAIDTGGTFTDCVWRAGGRVQVLKLPSTPEDPGRAIFAAIERILERTPASAVEIRHGTTVATNALLERKGARVAFVTTAGFEDTLAIGRQARPSLYNWDVHRARPLADEDCCFGLAERIAPDGTVLRAPTRADLARLRQRVRSSGSESVAVSLLFCFANPAHEQAVAAALDSLRLPVSFSHRILPEFREYERAATVALNAYLAPRMEGYLGGLEHGIARRFSGRNGTHRGQQNTRLSIMQSSGGILSAGAAAREPVRTILSGPAGGVMGAMSVARAAGIERALSFDLGGTSTDVALLETGQEPKTTTEGQVAGLPVCVPMLDIHTVGAGGGSLAWLDASGALAVGPHSAGADPGPACYGSGEQATVTDANLVLQRLSAEHFLGGAMRLDTARAQAAVERVGREAGIGRAEEMAEGIVRVANATMEGALRRVSVERGYDPRDFELVAFGGAGPLHACALAQALGMRKVLVPAAPGALSALGILDADLRREFSRTVMLTPGASQIAGVFRELEAEARASFAAEDARPLLKRAADLRYQGQGFELRVEWRPDVVERFHRLHERTYGYADRTRRVEIVTLRVLAVAKTPRPRQARSPMKRGDGRQARLAAHRVFEGGRWRRGALVDRSLLHPGECIPGPTVIVELSATTYLPSGWTARVDGARNMVMAPNRGGKP